LDAKRNFGLRKFFFTIILVIAPLLIFAQGEANIWHFGYGAGIDFNSGVAVAIPGYINTYEGCASICSSSGSLLFCTDGVTVYDTNGGIIATGLMGNSSATQSAIIVPDPGNASKYYIFTVPAVGIGGLHYSVVDMTLNGGLGGLVQTNIALVTPVCEKVTAVYAANGIDIWIITHVFQSNQFYAYKLTPLGVSAAIISPIGSNFGIGSSALGYMKASPDGTKLAVVGYGSGISNLFEVYDFDNASGLITNMISVPVPTTDLYGTTFSPDNTKLYVSSFNTPAHIFQYDLTLPNWWNSFTVVFGGGNYNTGALQLAPDGKIYVAENNSDSLSTIEFPNYAGAACGFMLHSFGLINHSAIGLPTFFEQLSIPVTCNVNLGADQLVCGNDTVILDAGAGGIGFFWSTGDTSQTIQVFSSGEYWVKKFFDSSCTDIDTIEVHFLPNPVLNLGNDTVLCPSTIFLLDAGSGFNYQWNTGSTSQSFHVNTTGTYAVTITDGAGCTASDSISLSFNGNSVSLGNDTTICIGNSVVINAGPGYSSYLWSNGSTDSTITVNTQGIYTVTVTSPGGCSSADSKVISISDPVIHLGNDTLVCGPLNYQLNAGSGFTSYTWQNNSHLQTFTVTSVGEYFVSAVNSYGCPASDTIQIQNSNPIVNIGSDTIICSGNSGEIIAGGTGFISYLWNTGETTTSITVNENGNYSVTVTDNAGCKDSESKIVSIDTPSVYIGTDTSSCNGSGIIFSAGNSFENYLWNNGSNEESVMSNGEGIYSVTVTDINGCTAADDARVNYAECMDIDLPTAFSPNNDGVNDFFHLLNPSDFKSGEIKVFNRWGELCWETNDLNNRWDGKFRGTDCDIDVYVYYMSATNYPDHTFSKKGNVTLLR